MRQPPWCLLQAGTPAAAVPLLSAAYEALSQVRPRSAGASGSLINHRSNRSSVFQMMPQCTALTEL